MQLIINYFWFVHVPFKNYFLARQRVGFIQKKKAGVIRPTI